MYVRTYVHTYVSIYVWIYTFVSQQTALDNIKKLSLHSVQNLCCWGSARSHFPVTISLNMRGDVQSEWAPSLPLSEARHISQGESQRMNAQYHAGSAELEAGGTAWHRPRMPPKPFHAREFPTSSALHHSSYTASQGLFANLVLYRSL
jgi:hypothetical protein